MHTWGIAVVAAGSAIVGGLPVAWFARHLRSRPSDQPEPMLALAAVYSAAVLGSARAEQQREFRRSGYADFIEAVDSALRAAVNGSVPLDQRRAVSHALDVMTLIGPDIVVEAAQQMAALVNTDRRRSPDDMEQVRNTFLTAARGALEPPDPFAL